MNTYWYHNAIFYHIYPLGLCGAPGHNDDSTPLVHRIERMYAWLEHAQSLGANALYLGPVFQSSTHGYDTRDYYRIDKRLGDNSAFAHFSDVVHQHGLQLVLDGVFNHVGRDFWAFKDLLEKGENSAYVDWFHNLRFGETNPKGDPFRYEAWQGHYDLVKLNLSNPDVRTHLFDAVGMWMDQFRIDGLRLDAADCIDLDFLRALRTFVKARRADFWLMGEVVHGDYRQRANPETLDSVTNYECYKGLFSSLKDANYFEIAYSLDRQFGDQGLYRDLRLYNFVDNHDVDRVASKLGYPACLFPLYLLLYCMPGIPSIYYGSEWGIEGVKGAFSDAPLRPTLDLNQLHQQSLGTKLVDVLRKLADIRQKLTALQHGNFQILHVDHQQFAFTRQIADETLIVVLNSAHAQVEIELSVPGEILDFVDLLETCVTYHGRDGHIRAMIPPAWGRILKRVS